MTPSTNAASDHGVSHRRIDKDQRAGSATRYSDDGDTLIEILVTITILGLAAVSLLGAFLTVISSSARHRSYAAIDTILKNFADAATYQIQMSSSPAAIFSPCATLSGTTLNNSPTTTYMTYNGTALNDYTPPAGYAITVTSSQYLVNNASFQDQAACKGVSGYSSFFWPQEFTVTATGPKGASSTLTFVVTDPAKVENNYQPAATTTTTSTTTSTSSTTSTTTTSTTIPRQDHVSDLGPVNTGSDRNSWGATASVSVSDANDNPLAGVTVSFTWTTFSRGQGTTAGTTSCTTDSSGSCQPQSVSVGSNNQSITFTVSGLTLSGYSYDSASNNPYPATVTVFQQRQSSN